MCTYMCIRALGRASEERSRMISFVACTGGFGPRKLYSQLSMRDNIGASARRFRESRSNRSRIYAGSTPALGRLYIHITYQSTRWLSNSICERISRCLCSAILLLYTRNLRQVRLAWEWTKLRLTVWCNARLFEGIVGIIAGGRITMSKLKH